MSHISNTEPPTRIEGDLPNVALFHISIVPEWAKDITHFLENGLPFDHTVNRDRALRFIKIVTPYQLWLQGNYTNEAKIVAYVNVS